MAGLIPVGILGATGAVGQQMVVLLQSHPQFHLAVVGASDRSAGQIYTAACTWRQPTPLSKQIADLVVVDCAPANFVGKCALVFSALGTDIAGEVETAFAKAGIKVCSNSSPHRQDPDVPLIVPYVNPEHIEMVRSQPTFSSGGGWIITNANCSTTGLVTALKPLHDAFGIEECMVTTMQAISGAGFTGIHALDIADNVVPYIGGEEEKLELEPLKILGSFSSTTGRAEHLTNMRLSAQCNRVNVTDGHMVCVSVRLARDPKSVEQVTRAIQEFKPNLPANLPSLPEAAITVLSQTNRPQPRLDRNAGGGYTVSVGRVRECPLMGYKFVCLVHNIVMGAAGSALLNAELAHAKGLV